MEPTPQGVAVPTRARRGWGSGAVEQPRDGAMPLWRRPGGLPGRSHAFDANQTR